METRPAVKPKLRLRLSFRQVKMDNFAPGFGHLLDTSLFQLMNSILIFVTAFFVPLFPGKYVQERKGL